MWSRSELKERAKAVLKTNYWEAFWISIVVSLAGGDGGGGGGGSGGSGNYSNSYSSLDSSSMYRSFVCSALSKCNFCAVVFGASSKCN